jgi:hypothetical protein
MVKIKGIFALGVIILFMGLAVSPVTAQMTVQEQFESKMSELRSAQLTTVQFSEKDLTTIGDFLPMLLEEVKTATSYNELVSTMQNLLVEYGRQPVLVLLLTLLIKSIDFNFKIGQLRPLRRSAFIMSWGFTNKFLSLGKNKLNMVRPFTGWLYSGKSNVLLNSRTIIFDLHPFSIRTLTGRQVGFMTDFLGLYIHRTSTIGDKAITFFFGHAQVIRGFDLSPMKN